MGGARAGLVAPDEKAFRFLKGRPMSPKGETWDAAMRYMGTLRSDDGAHFDHEIGWMRQTAAIVTWAPRPKTWCRLTGVVPDPADCR